MSGYVALLRHNASFRNLWLARVVSNLGDWFNLLASAALVSRLTGTGSAISFLFLARFLPLFLMSPFAGVLADRFDRRRILIVADLLRALTVLGFLLVRSADQVWLLYALTALQFAFSALFTPAQTALIPDIVAEDELATANTLDSLTWSTMLAVGSMLGGLAAAFLGVQAAFVLDSLSFLVSAWFVSRVHPQAGRRHVAAGDQPGLREGMTAFVEGLRYLTGRRTLLVIALVKAGGALIWGGVNVLEVPLAVDAFPLNGNGSLTLGLIYAAVGLGTGFGPLVLREVLGDTYGGMFKAVTLGFVASTLGVLGLALAPSLPWALAATLVRGVGTGALWVFSTVLLQLLVADRLRGRVFAFEFAALTLTQSVSTLWAGYAYDAWGLSLQQIFLVTGLASIVVTVGWVAFQARAAPRHFAAPGRNQGDAL